MSTYSQLKFQNDELIQQQNLLHSGMRYSLIKIVGFFCLYRLYFIQNNLCATQMKLRTGDVL
jgi:hypothetical protein